MIHGYSVEAEQKNVAVLVAEPKDIEILTDLVRAGIRPLNEHFEKDSHLDDIIPKPWGYEYRVYVDDFYDCWNLNIDPGHATSTHAHPRKLTYLLCLDGEGQTTGFSRQHRLSGGAIVRISPGAFHETRNTGAATLSLIEVETPRNKFDLIRAQDGYSRATTAYEAESQSLPNHPMKRVRHLPHARMRTASPDGRFSFQVRTGMDLFYRRRPEDLFSVPLTLGGMVNGDIRILVGSARDDLITDLYYLSIATTR